MKAFMSIAALALLIIMSAAVMDSFRAHRFVTKVQAIKAGDGKEQVEAKLGRATRVFRPPEKVSHPLFLFLGVQVETWAYGERFDWQHCFHSKFPYFWPLKFRLFGPDMDDVTVEFDSTGKVRRFSTPRAP
jgi:hypothetical protein